MTVCIIRCGMHRHSTIIDSNYFLLPLIIIFPLITGIDGIMYAGPVAYGMAGIVSIIVVSAELKNVKYKTGVV